MEIDDCRESIIPMQSDEITGHKLAATAYEVDELPLRQISVTNKLQKSQRERERANGKLHHLLPLHPTLGLKSPEHQM